MSKSKKREVRILGDILLDMEPLMHEAMEQGLQWGDMLALVHVWLMTHRPDEQEVYTSDGTSPVFKYGPSDTVKNNA